MVPGIDIGKERRRIAGEELLKEGIAPARCVQAEALREIDLIHMPRADIVFDFFNGAQILCFFKI